MKSVNIDIWVIDTLNQLFVRGSYTEIKFSINKVVSGKAPFSLVGPFCTPHAICLNNGLRQGSIVWKCSTFNLITLN